MNHMDRERDTYALSRAFSAFGEILASVVLIFGGAILVGLATLV